MDSKHKQEIRDRYEAATKGRDLQLWRYEHGGGRLAVYSEKDQGNRQLIADFYDEGNREFYVEALNDIPDLLDALEKAESTLYDFKRLVRSLLDEIYEFGVPMDGHIMDALESRIADID